MHSLQWIIEGNFNHYVKTRVTYFHCRPGPGLGPGKLCPGPARSPQHYYLLARARPGPVSFRPAHGPARKISLRPGPAHGLRAGPARGPRPGPCRTLTCITQSCAFQLFSLKSLFKQPFTAQIVISGKICNFNVFLATSSLQCRLACFITLKLIVTLTIPYLTKPVSTFRVRDTNNLNRQEI